ncbi:MAG: PKD domain-containing protein [Bacteroidia bacterium]
MIKRYILTGIVSCAMFVAQAQNGSTPVVGQNPMAQQSSMRSGDPQTPQDGSATLGPVYQFSSCGLNYTTVSQKLGQRVFPPGVPQPATFTVAGIPATANIVRAFLWCEGSGNGAPITATVTNPAPLAQNYNMTLIGSDADKCWGYQGTHSYRADITSIIIGNGNYLVDGLPTSISSGGTNDMDGATIMVIWDDPTATFQGDIVIWDGCFVGIGNFNSITLNGFTACAGVVSNSRAFMGIGDLQGLATPLVLNSNAPYLIPLEDWWNWVDNPTTVTPGQNTSYFDVNAMGDCYNITVAGIYFQSNCQTCCANPFTLNMAQVPSSCSANNGSASATPSNGAGPFGYTWNTVPPQTGQTATNLAPGQYIVSVIDSSSGCTFVDTVVVLATGTMTITTASTNVTCNGGSNGSATVTPTSGNAPYTYAWLPNVSATNTASNLSAGQYAVVVTDLYGCTNSFTFTITEPQLIPLSVNVTGNNTICTGSSTTLTANPAGGSGPPYTFNWMPGNINTQTNTVSPVVTTTYTVILGDQCGTPQDTTTFTVTVNQLPIISFTGDNLEGCAPVCVNFTSTSAPAAVNCSWDFGDGVGNGCNINHCYQLPGTYNVQLTVTDVNGCINTTTINNYINVYPYPVAGFNITSPQPATLIEANILFDNQSTGGDTCYWDLGDGSPMVIDPNCSDISHNYADTGMYSVMQVVINQYGCSDTAWGDVIIVPYTTIYIPNTFTPNGDGKNDFFFAYGNYVTDFQMMIFDRWGNLIFQSNDINKGWDGRANGGKDIAQIDTYVYVVSCKELYTGKAKKFRGHVNLVK